MANELGKRYRCEVCGTEVLCTKAGEGAAQCCEESLVYLKPKPLESSD